MKVIIAGSRNLDPVLVVDAMEHWDFGPITEVVSGGARGIDMGGESWAKFNGIPVRVMAADWEHLGRGAGPNRNERMAAYADALCLIWDGKSRGSANMLSMARKYKLDVMIYYPLDKDRPLYWEQYIG